MKLETIAAKHGPGVHTAAAIVIACSAAFLVFANWPLIPDIAWIIEASRRWLGGEVLYRDIIEVNPPLIFYETVALTGGFLTQTAYIAGVCTVIGLSAFWIARLRGSYAALAALAAMIVSGLGDFGQRDHLALIFVLPLVARDRPARAERVSLGLWAFFGVGLKPYLLPIVAADALCRSLCRRSLRAAFGTEYLTVALVCLAYLAFVAAAHPAYLSEIVPLGRFIYGAYGADIKPALVLLSTSLVLAAILWRRDPLAWATVAALGSFYLQGRFWSYHLVPAIGFGIMLSLIEARKSRPGLLVAGILVLQQLARGPLPTLHPSPIPPGASSVAVLSTHVWAAYPAVLDRGIRNSTRYPALWTLPGAWNIATDPDEPSARRARAKRILIHERTTIRSDILRDRPELILVEHPTRDEYFNRPFDYMKFLGPLPGYTYVGERGRYAVYERCR